MTTVYVTAPPESAGEISRTLVEERLAACVNKVECESVFRWDGDVVEADEFALLVKTTAERYDELEARILEIHPHDVACIERFEPADVSGEFSEWISDALR